MESSTDIRDERIYREAAALWREIHGEAPPIRADGALMLDIVMKSLADVGYERLSSPHLRPNSMGQRG